MQYQALLARIYLLAVLRNLELLAAEDDQSRSLVRDWDLSIGFKVLGGAEARLVFQGGRCSFSPGKSAGSKVKLLFVSPGHFNRMMRKSANPIPVKGFRWLRFLTKDFAMLTDRLEYFLEPSSQRMQEPGYKRLNVLLSLHTAIWALKEIAAHDPEGRLVCSQIPDGTLVLTVRGGPTAYLSFLAPDFTVGWGEPVGDPQAVLELKDLDVAAAFFQNKLDPFSAIAKGDLVIRGQIPILDGASLLLDRIEHYLGEERS